jgi:hypothetical protein
MLIKIYRVTYRDITEDWSRPLTPPDLCYVYAPDNRDETLIKILTRNRKLYARHFIIKDTKETGFIIDRNLPVYR